MAKGFLTPTCLVTRLCNVADDHSSSPLISSLSLSPPPLPLNQCLTKDYEKRKRAAELLGHPFLANINERKARAALRSCPHIISAAAGGDTKSAAPTQPVQGKAAAAHSRSAADDDVTKQRALERAAMERLAEDVDSRMPQHATDQLATQRDFSENYIVSTLEKRFNDGAIYTHVGEVVLAVNPYRSLPIYDKDFQERYSLDAPLPPKRPHVYGLALNAFRAMAHEGINQSCVVSGESGAGKTESAKYFLRHLLDLSSGVRSAAGKSSLLERYELMQYAMNDLLEAFGNARTRANRNSSRFGKYVEISFNSKHQAVGASLSHYLLEKSRVVHQCENERNFHVFYYLLNGLDRPMLRAFQLSGNVADYTFINGGVAPDARIGGKMPPVSTGPSDGHERFVQMRKMMLVRGALFHLSSRGSLGCLSLHSGPANR